MSSQCNCKSQNPEMLESNCICNDCKCHFYKRNLGEIENNDNDNDSSIINKESFLQTKIRNYGFVILGTSTIIYTMYIFCCEKHLGSLSF